MKLVPENGLAWIGLLALLAVAGVGHPAYAQIAASSSALPPDSDPPDCDYVPSHYAASADSAVLFPNGIDINSSRYHCFTNVQTTTDPPTGDETESFDAIVTGTFDNGSGPLVVSLTGPVSVVVYGRGGSPTGSWQTEILSMDLAGDMAGIPIQIRESVTFPSLGQTTVAQIGASQFVVDSFFDVFIELSIAGGPFEPHTTGPARMVLERVVRRSAILPTPDLPPEPDPLNCDRLVSRHVGSDVHAQFPNGISLGNPTYKCFQNVVTNTDPGTGDETLDFDSKVEGLLDDGSGPQKVKLTGPKKKVVRGRGGASTGTWDTEILSMNLQGDVGGVSIEIRESPSKKSPGKKKVKDRGDGTFQIDSFFDVFTELSVDGGPFQPQTNPGGRIELERIPPQAVLPSPGLPPERDPPNCDRLESRYAGGAQHALYPGGIDFSDPVHRCFKNTQVTTDPGTGDETQTFDAIVEGKFDDGSGPQKAKLKGPVTKVARGKRGASAGSWDTEILSMDLSGDIGGVSIDIRESPKLPSPGKKKVKDRGDGTFQIDSFFDVFTEISIGGGPFQPQTNDAGRIELERIRPTARLRHSGLPPERDPANCDRLASRYAGGAQHAVYPNGIDFSDPVHRCFKNTQVTTDPGTGDETQTFDAIVEGKFDDGSGPQKAKLKGPVTKVARGKGGASTGSWDTEILSMDLSGDVGGVSIDIRESPNKKSPGKKKVKKDAGDGRFVIDSFFDVFTELSIDGGPFQPQTNGAGRLYLEPIRPSVERPDASLPPEPDPADCTEVETRYEGVGLHALLPNGIDLSRVRQQCFTNVQTTVDPPTGDETESFDAVVTGIFDDGSGPQKVELSGPVQKVTRSRGGASTGSWDTEILSMNLSGDVGGISIDIRESPNKKSPGKTKIKDNGDGTFQVDSFFDVFTELSIDGGPFQPQTNEAARLDLQRARPSAILPQPDLPPEPDPADCASVSSSYGGLDPLLAQFPNGLVTTEPVHKCFQNVVISVDGGTGDETGEFDSTLELMVDIGAGPEAVVLTGPVEVVTFGKGSDTTGTWDTEMLSMSLSGSVSGIPIQIRESPSKKSEGKTKVDDVGGGQFEIDSFFDVFTEISVDGGPFQPQTNEAARLELQVPEPASWLGILAAIPVLRVMAKRRRAKSR